MVDKFSHIRNLSKIDRFLTSNLSKQMRRVLSAVVIARRLVHLVINKPTNFNLSKRHESFADKRNADKLFANLIICIADINNKEFI